MFKLTHYHRANAGLDSAKYDHSQFTFVLFIGVQVISENNAVTYHSLPAGRKACFGIIDDPSYRSLAIILRAGGLAYYFSPARESQSVQKILVTPEEELKPGRLAGLFDTIAADRAMIRFGEEGADLRLALSTSVMQGCAVTANDITLRGASYAENDQRRVVPRWFEEELDHHQVTLAEMDFALKRHTGILPQVPAPPVAPSINEVPCARPPVLERSHAAIEAGLR